MKSYGIMGGTFDPIHYGHLHIAESALHEFNLDKVWFVPNNHPAYKDRQNLSSAEHRINMIKLAIEPYYDFDINTIEIERGGDTYTVDTVEEFKKMYSHDKLFFIIGLDSLLSFLDWKAPDRIIECCDILVGTRNNVTVEKVMKKIDEIEDQLGVDGKIHLIHSTKLFKRPVSMGEEATFSDMIATGGISSSDIRNSIAQKKTKINGGLLPIKNAMSSEELQYIKNNKLYM